MGAVKAAVADGIITFMWIFCTSSLGPATYLVASSLGVSGFGALAVTTLLVFLLLFAFGIIGGLLGGATFNPTATAAFYAVGVGADLSLFSAALRFPAQAAGAVGGVLAAREAMPVQYKHMLGGPYLKVDSHTGAIAEGILTFLITFGVLYIVLRGPKSPVAKNFLISVLTVSLVVAGSGYTGPSMNPANAFGWAYINQKHNTLEHFYVYWISPFIGAILSASIFRFVFPPPAPEQKNNKKKKA